MSEKITGYALLGIGILLIVAAAVSVYLVFTKQIPPIDLFNFPAITMDPSTLLSGSLPANLVGVSKPGLAPKMELVSADMLNQTANIAAHVFLMGFIVNVGFKIASLGTQLVRPIVVKAKE